MLAPILGPVVGGVILQNLPLVLDLPRERPDRRRRVLPRLAHRSRTPTPARRAGSTWSAWCCCRRRPALIVYGLAQLGSNSDRLRPRVDRGRSSPGSCSPGVFCLHALRIERPLLDVRLYANRVFAAASLTTFALGAALFGAMILVPLYYQEVRHESVIVTGLLTGPQGLGMLLVMPIAGRLTERFGGGRDRARSGVSILALSTIPLAFIGAEHLDPRDLGRARACAASASASRSCPR